MTTETWRLSATELSFLVRNREISAREVALAALERIESVNPMINAIVDYSPNQVLAQADRIDETIRRGEEPGPLAGVPVTTKINTDHAGFATTNGTRLQIGHVARVNSPAVDNLVKAGAVLLGRSSSPTFALRWFTDNLVHGHTLNPRNSTITPGGSSGGGAAAVAVGMGCIALGTDIGGSIRYPAYACGVHGLRPTFGRVPAFNASLPERPIGAQLMSATGPIARTVGDLELALAAMSAADMRDPWWVPAPLHGQKAELRAAICLRPGGMEIASEVELALIDAARRLADAGWAVEEIDDVPQIRDAAEIQERLWLGDGFPALVDAVTRDGDLGAKAVVDGVRHTVNAMPPDVIKESLVRRTTLTRTWRDFLSRYPVLLLPVSAELPFRDGLDMEGEDGFRRVWQAQLTMRALPAVGLPGLVVSTTLVDSIPVGVQIVANHYREDLCLLAGKAIEARGTPQSPIDPSPPSIPDALRH